MQSGVLPIDDNASPWTGCPQSFMDLPGTGPYLHNGVVRREDVWRLLHLPPVLIEDGSDHLRYRRHPFTPWAPPGSMPEAHSALRVRLRLRGERHAFEYSGWTRGEKGGTLIEAVEFASSVSEYPSISPELPAVALIFPKIPAYQGASQRASCGILDWVMLSGEGIPKEELYDNEWLLNRHHDAGNDEDLPESNEDIKLAHVEERNKVIVNWLSSLPACDGIQHSATILEFSRIQA